MRIISFENFKSNCRHVETFDVSMMRKEFPVCSRPFNDVESYTMLYGYKVFYHPCTEKTCPVLSYCKIHK